VHISRLVLLIPTHFSIVGDNLLPTVEVWEGTHPLGKRVLVRSHWTHYGAVVFDGEFDAVAGLEA
jgi:hypothetical protein